jgi:hypothetical protein
MRGTHVAGMLSTASTTRSRHPGAKACLGCLHVAWPREDLRFQACLASPELRSVHTISRLVRAKPLAWAAARVQCASGIAHAALKTSGIYLLCILSIQA